MEVYGWLFLAVSRQVLSTTRSITALQDFFSKDCWAHHPKPYAEYMDWRKKEDERWENDVKRLVPGMCSGVCVTPESIRDTAMVRSAPVFQAL